jgi:GNAT superfamily N-acetyltransferase
VSGVAAEPRIRRAQRADEPRLREIAAAAKGHWGYGADRVREWAARLDPVSGGESWVATLEGDAVVAWLALVVGPSVCILEDLWVEPAFIGRGIGSALFRFAADRARELGASRLQWEAEPNATGFYEKLGGVQVGETLGSWGRPVPVMQYDLTR